MANIFLQFLNEFIALTIHILPFFVAGTAFAAFLSSSTKLDFIGQYLNKGTRSVVYATLLGSLLPGCSCSTIPMAEGLKKKGASLGTLTSFMMVSALLAPQTIILTYGVLGFKFTIARIVFSVVGAISLGLIFNYLQSRNISGFTPPMSSIQSSPKQGCCSACPPVEEERKGFWDSFITIAKDLGKYFILGMIIATALTVFIPQDAIVKHIGSSGALAYLSAALIGIPLYVCEGEEIPITLALMKIGLDVVDSLSISRYLSQL